MACQEFESRILDYLENQLPLTEHLAVETHLAGCADCQVFARQLHRLDTALTCGIKAPILPADFSERLWQRIQAETVLLPERHRAERKRQLQTEFEVSLARLRRQSLRRICLLDSLGYLVAAGLVGWSIIKIGPGFTDLGAQLHLAGFVQSLLLSLAASAVFLLIGLGPVHRRQSGWFRR